MLAFQTPEILYLLILVPTIVVIHLVSLKGHKRRALKFANFETISRLQGKKFAKDIPLLLLRLIFLSLLVLAFAGVQWEYTATGYPEEIILAVDTSGSMLADDIEPTRFQATKDAIEDFLSNESIQARVGLVTFTSLAYLQHEPTFEKTLLIDALRKIEIQKTGGTSLAVPISFSEVVFETDKKSLVLLTDGQENIFSERELREAVNKASQNGLTINMVGIGTEHGAPITEEAEGNSVINTDIFSLISEESEGEYSLAQSQEQIRQALLSFFEQEQVLVQKSLGFHVFIAAIIVLIIEWYFSNYLFRAFP
ncbi:MAG: vWA domain-containing protein [Nanobdellota archaeon]